MPQNKLTQKAHYHEEPNTYENTAYGG